MCQNLWLALYVIQIYTMARASINNIVPSFVDESNAFHFLRLLEFVKIFIFMHFGVKISVMLKLYQKANILKILKLNIAIYSVVLKQIDNLLRKVW